MRTERQRSFHPRRVFEILRPMPSAAPQSNRLATCARADCRRLFAVCGRFDRGRRSCSSECSQHGRRTSLRRAGTAYQATQRGRQLHAVRQARYRDQLRRVTHQSAPPPEPQPAEVLAPRPIDATASVSMSSPRPPAAFPSVSKPTECAGCQQCSAFVHLAVGLRRKRVRPRRDRRSSRAARPRPHRYLRSPPADAGAPEPVTRH